MNTNKFLPIGSVVLLEGEQKQLVISGYHASIEENREIYDYMGILYPEGIQGNKDYYFFNHDQIAKVSYVGYESTEYKELNEELLQQFGGTHE